jgi:hypothetical protein
MNATTMHRNYINGDWLEGYSASDARDIIGSYTKADAAQAGQPARSSSAPMHSILSATRSLRGVSN